MGVSVGECFVFSSLVLIRLGFVSQFLFIVTQTEASLEAQSDVSFVLGWEDYLFVLYCGSLLLGVVWVFWFLTTLTRSFWLGGLGISVWGMSLFLRSGGRVLLGCDFNLLLCMVLCVPLCRF